MNDWLRHLIESFVKEHFFSATAAPDGVMDLTAILEEFVDLSHRERPFDSFKGQGLMEPLALLVFGSTDSINRRNPETVMLRTFILLALILRIVSNEFTIMPEEVIRKIFDSDDFDRLRTDLSIVPFDFDDEEFPIPRLSTLSVFSEPLTFGLEHIIGFVSRNRFAQKEIEGLWDSFCPDSVDSDREGPDFEIVDPSEVDFVSEDAGSLDWYGLYEKLIENWGDNYEF